MWVSFLKEKYEVFEKFKIFNNRVENESSVNIKCLKSYRGGECTSRCFVNKWNQETNIVTQDP